MKIGLQPRLRQRTIILAACAVILTWLVVSRSFAAYFADVSPQMALRLNPWEPSALVNRADTMISGSEIQSRDPRKITSDSATTAASNEALNSQNSSHTFSAFDLIDQKQSIDLSTVRALAESAVMQEPLNARALRILGQVAEVANKHTDALEYMRTALHVSLRESTAAFWLMLKSAETGDYKHVIFYADVLLRTRPELASYVVPMMAQIAEDKASAGLLNTILATDPPWRTQFFAALPNSVQDVRTPLDLLLALRSSPTPPTSADISHYIDFLVTHKFYRLAYYTWLQFLPSEDLRNAGFLFNGDFMVTPSGLPFDWEITQGSGVTISLLPRSNTNADHGLLVDFEYGRVDYHSVTELIMLAPGTYEFDGKYKGALVGPRGLKWRVACIGESTKIVGESPMITGKTGDWRSVAFTFSVPVMECPAQYIRLDLDARMTSEQLVSGSMLFDELRISRLANPPS